MCFFKRGNGKTAENGQPAFPEKDASSWYRSLPGDLYAKWPKIDGRPEEPAFLTHRTSVDMEDAMLVNMLAAYGIPAVKMYPGSGAFGVVVLGMSAEGSDIFVPASQLSDAAALIEGDSND